MHEPDFWSNCAEAMELSIEGNRLIVRELQEALRALWQRLTRSLPGVSRGFGRPGDLPPA